MYLSPTLTVDLGAIVANWQLLRARFTGEECAAAVKADAYGLGALPVARALSDAGCDTFFVATLEEALALRAALTDVRILVFHGVNAGEEFAFAAHRLIPVLNSPAQIARWKPVAAEHVHAVAALHIDTAMGRLGLQPEEFTALMDAQPTLLEQCRIGLLLSHLACAPEAEHPLNAAQLKRFTDVCARAPGIPASLCNSGGIFLAADYHFNLARPGCSLYGIAPQSMDMNSAGEPALRTITSSANPMRQVAQWEAPILMTRTLEREQTVGYGATVSAPAGTRIATVMSGYADGYLRSLTGKGCGYVGDFRVPLIGRVTMDMLCFDVTQAPEALCGEGMPLTLLGDRDGIRVDDLAAAAGTIGYEVLSRIGTRVARQYRETP